MIGFNGRPFGKDKAVYNTTGYTSVTVRQERLHIPTGIAMSSMAANSEFRCENKRHTWSHIYLKIPGNHAKHVVVTKMLFKSWSLDSLSNLPNTTHVYIHVQIEFRQ